MKVHNNPYSHGPAKETILAIKSVKHEGELGWIVLSHRNKREKPFAVFFEDTLNDRFPLLYTYSLREALDEAEKHGGKGI